jgi:hypothetical protein
MTFTKAPKSKAPAPKHPFKSSLKKPLPIPREPAFAGSSNPHQQGTVQNRPSALQNTGNNASFAPVFPPYPTEQNNLQNPFGSSFSRGYQSSNTSAFVPPAFSQLPPASQHNAEPSTKPVAFSTQPQQSTPFRPTNHSLASLPLLRNINPKASLDELFKAAAASLNSNNNVNSNTAINETILKPPAVESSSPSKPVAAPSFSTVNPISSFNFKPYQSPLSTMGITNVPDSKSNTQKPTGSLCIAESSGGVCRDKDCPHAHFSDF